MAAAEARAAWQRTANRCFVQEDAKRAPKLACCPSSTPLHDTGNDNSESPSDQPVSNFVPINWNLKNSNLPSDTKWWLQCQPNYGYQKDALCEKLNNLDNEFASKRIDNMLQSPKHNNDKSTALENTGSKDCDDCSSESPRMVTTAFRKHDTESKFEYTKAIPNNVQQLLTPKMATCEYLYKDAEQIDWNQADPFIVEKPQKAVTKTEFPWEENNRSTPWWRISDRDELASFVAQKSSQHIENCDLPRPTQVLVRSDPYASLECSETTVVFSESSCQKFHGGACNPVDFKKHSSTSGCMNVRYRGSCESNLLHGLDQKDSAHTNNTVSQGVLDSKLNSGSDASRVQLMEALRHSQTRAREAEMAAQKAYNEKEHIVQLLFRQASQLFAYKQWFHVLQLEAQCLHLKVKEYQISTILPDLPWSPMKGKPESRDRRREKKKQKPRGRPCSICKKLVIFAVGLGLAGAGMLLGWTIGWLLPCL